MLWVYDNTHSGPLAQLMHFSYTGSLGLFVPLTAISRLQDALVYVALTVVLWLLVASLVAVARQRASRVYPANSSATPTIS
jgi:uncharacterized membrane protein